MENFVTLFDVFFLPQGLALHRSMVRNIKDFTLWILCVDDQVYDLLIKLKLNNVRLLQLSKLETPELLAVKVTRNKGEYCWTLTPFAPRFVFEADQSINRVTYLDADLWFRQSPIEIFNELISSGKDVLITDHGYAPEYDQSATSGQYCVQFMIFTRIGGECVRKWWEERCLEWCFARHEGGKFGDQMYLDDWPTRFKDAVHVLGNQELALAPWNISRYPYNKSIFFHFQGLKIVNENLVDLGAMYPIIKPVKENIYKPYLVDLKKSIMEIKFIGFEIKNQRCSVTRAEAIRRILRKIFNKFKNIDSGFELI